MVPEFKNGGNQPRGKQMLLERITAPEDHSFQKIFQRAADSACSYYTMNKIFKSHRF